MKTSICVSYFSNKISCAALHLLKYSENANELLFSNFDNFALHLSNLAAHSMQNNNFPTEILLDRGNSKIK